MGEFVMNNLALVALFLASGVMLLWPEISKISGGTGAQIGTLEATRLMNQQGSTLVLDVSDDKDFASGHLPRARNIPVRELSGRIGEIGKFKEKNVIVTSRNNVKSSAASRFLKREGFKAVYQLKGGTNAWQQASLPVEK
jgi:rhodanese-related sulfurtransferase